MGNKFLENNSDKFYFVFRILIGLVFFLHGWMKLPGILSGETALFSLFWFAGVIELIAGVFLVIGLLVREVALISAIEMLVAYFYVHVPSGGLHPLQNKGEAALLFFAAFLVLMSFGARKWSIDGKRKK